MARVDTLFTFDGYTIRIGQDVISSFGTDRSGSFAAGTVVLEVRQEDIGPVSANSDGAPIRLCAFHLQPSHARSLASAILAAATEAQKLPAGRITA